MSLFYQRQCHGCGEPCDGYYCESCMCPQRGMTLFNGIYDNCIYGAGMPIICTECGGIVRGGICLPCNLREKDLYNYDPNAYSFDNSNYFPQPQDKNYLCNLCGNNSHDGYDCQQQFPFVYEQEPSYNQNYDDIYYPHESPSYTCCDYYGGSHETFQCQPDNQNVDFSGSDQIQTPQFNYIPFEENPQILFQTWETFFAIQCSQPEYSNELFQKLLKDLKELAEYDQSTNTDCPIFLNSNEGHFVQDKESLENPFNEIADNESDLEPEATTDMELSSTKDIHPLAVQESPHDSDICHITPDTESDEVIESNAENLLPIPSKCEVTLEDEIEYDMHAKDVCSPVFTPFSNPLFKDNDDLDSSNDESLPDDDVPAEEFKIYSNPLCDEDEINSDKLDPHCFNVKYDFVESLLNRDTFIDFSSKFDFSGELAHIKPEILKSDFDFEEEIRLIENLVYDNSFPRPSEKLNAEIADTIIESIPLLPIPVQDGNSQQEEIDIVTETKDVLPSSVENDDDDYDLLLGEADLFLSDNSIPPGIENIADDPEGDDYPPMVEAFLCRILSWFLRPS
nr:hypothetical protein [Tanacetum cinerariifolium]